MEFEYEYKKYRKLNFNSRFKEKEYDKSFYKLLNEYISRLSYELSLSSEQIDELVDKILENVDNINYTDNLDMYVLGDFNADEKSINLNKKLLNPNSKYSLFFTLCRELTHAQGYDEKTNSFGMYKNGENTNVDYEGTGLDELITEMISTLITNESSYLLEEQNNVAMSSIYYQLLFIGQIIASVLGISKKYLLKVAYNKRDVFDEVMSKRFLNNEIYQRFILEVSLSVSSIKNILEDIDLSLDERNKNLKLAFENLCNIANLFLVERSKADIKEDPYQDLGDYIESIQFDYINILYNLKLAAHSFGISFNELNINEFLKSDFIDRVNYLLTLFSYEQTKNVYEYNISNYYSDEYVGKDLKELASGKFGMEYVGKKLPIEVELDMQDMEEIVIPERIKVYKDPYLSSYVARTFYDKNISDIAKSKFNEKINENTEKIKNMYHSLIEKFGFKDEKIKALPEANTLEENINNEVNVENLNDDKVEENIPYDITSYINLYEEPLKQEEKKDDVINETTTKEEEKSDFLNDTIMVPVIKDEKIEEDEKSEENLQEKLKQDEKNINSDNENKILEEQNENKISDELKKITEEIQKEISNLRTDIESIETAEEKQEETKDFSQMDNTTKSEESVEIIEENVELKKPRHRKRKGAM